MSLRVELDSVQTRARRLLAPGIVCAFPWGRGSGKTFYARSSVHEFTLGTPGSHVGIIYPTLKRARQVIWAQLRPDYTNELRHVVASRDMTNLEVLFKNGSRLTTWGAENASAIRGQRFTHILEDEADEIHPDTEHAIIEPTLSKVGLSFIWAKFGTPARGRHGILFRDYHRGQTGVAGYRSLRVRSADSPQVDQDWLARVKQTTPSSIYSREYECDFDSAEGLVYGGVFGAANVLEPPPDIQWSDIIIGCDHGWEHPGVFLLIGILGSGRDATAWVIAEVFAKQKTEGWWKAKLSEWIRDYPSARLYGDPSMPARLEVYRRECRAKVQEVDNSVEDGIEFVAHRMMPAPLPGRPEEMRPRLLVHPRCVNLLTELGYGASGLADIAEGSYRRKRDPQNSERFLDDVEKRNDDGCDALRYPIFNYFGGPDRRRAGSPHEALG